MNDIITPYKYADVKNSEKTANFKDNTTHSVDLVIELASACFGKVNQHKPTMITMITIKIATGSTIADRARPR